MLKRAVGFVKRQRKPFKINMVRASFQHFFTSLTQQYQSIYIVELGANALQLGLVNGIGGIASAIVAFPTGLLADKYGIRRMFLLGIPLVAFGSLIFVLSTDWLMTIPAIFITLLSLQILMTVCPMVCGSYLKTGERATGMQLCDTVSAIPGIFSPMIAALVITASGGLTAEGIRPLYILQIIGFLFLWFFVLKYYTENIERKPKLNEKTGFLKNMRDIFLRRKSVKRWIVYRALSDISWFGSLTYVPLFAAEVKGADQFVLGGMATASMIIPLVLAVPMGRLADTVGRKKTIYTVTPFYFISILLLIYAPNPTTLLASAFLQGFMILGGVTQGAITQELVTTSLLGTWWGALSLLSGITRVFGPVTCGIIWSMIGPSYVFFFILSLEVSKIILLWLVVPETLEISGRVA